MRVDIKRCWKHGPHMGPACLDCSKDRADEARAKIEAAEQHRVYVDPGRADWEALQPASLPGYDTHGDAGGKLVPWREQLQQTLSPRDFATIDTPLGKTFLSIAEKLARDMDRAREGFAAVRLPETIKPEPSLMEWADQECSAAGICKWEIIGRHDTSTVEIRLGSHRGETTTRMAFDVYYFDQRYWWQKSIEEHARKGDA